MTRQCPKCKKVYPDTAENFPRANERQCRSCQRARSKRYYKEHQEQVRAYQRWYYEEHRDQTAACGKRHYKEHQEQVIARSRKYREEHREQVRAQQREHWRQLRLEVLNRYAPDGLQCACCGEGHVEFLCIDHINGQGNQHRKSIKSDLYNWLKKHGFPDGFRVLCLNCNGSLGHYGYCPHKS